MPVNRVATQRISYAIADLTSTKTRIVISPQCSSILSVVRFSTVGRFRSFLGSLRIDLLISAQLASSSSTSHSGHLSRLGSWSFGPGLVPSAVIVQRQSTEVPTILRSQTRQVSDRDFCWCPEYSALFVEFESTGSKMP